MTPGERFKNWSDAFMTLWPAIALLFGLLGYSNKDELIDWVGLAEVDGQTEIAGPTDFQQQVKRFSEEVRVELQEIKANSTAIRQQLSQRDNQNYQSLVKKLDAIQAQVSEIAELVN